ncbi:hypothetical protein M0802_001335 [Mischocyttarus mexicanus]|nr:hypothetical protein M0802_001335 [Mischocyttarus mexicanus]
MVSGCLRDIIWRNKHMSINCKTRIYKTCVRPIISNGIETRTETATTKKLLRNTEMKTLRTITGKTLFDHQRNDDIKRNYNIQSLQKPNTSRLPGRPLKRWYDSWTFSSQEQ